MRPALTSDELRNCSRQPLKPSFFSCQLEAAAHNNLLQISDYDSTQDSINRQNQAISQDEPTAS